MSNFKIGNTLVGTGQPTYFIAEIGANHEGDLNRAFKLIELAKEAGADCAKFQHYKADLLACYTGFASLEGLAHYTDNPYRIFRKYEIPDGWTPLLREHCDKVGIEFMSTPYSLEAVDHLEPYVNAYKIGSGDITYRQLIKHAASKGKPILVATGASYAEEVLYAMEVLEDVDSLCLMQCNTNYKADLADMVYLNLKVLEEYKEDFGCVTGLSDHSLSTMPVMTAVTLGASIIEKHFTDDILRKGPDHPFALDPHEFRNMVLNVRELEQMLGDGEKKLEANETETVILQRRAIRAGRNLTLGSKVESGDLTFLRPAPGGSLPPFWASEVVGSRLRRDVAEGDYLREEDFG